MTHRRINETIGIRYDDADKMDGIVKSVETMLREHSEIDSSQIHTIVMVFTDIF